MGRPPTQRLKVENYLRSRVADLPESDTEIARKLEVSRHTVINAKQAFRRERVLDILDEALDRWDRGEVVLTSKTETDNGEETVRLKLVPPTDPGGAALSSFDPDDPTYIDTEMV